MRRRDFLKTTGSAAAAAGVSAAAIARPAGAEPSPSVSAPNISSGVRGLRLALTAPDNGHGLGESGRRLVQRIGILTGGRIKTEVLFDQTTVDADLWHGSAHDHVTSATAFSYFAGLPGQNGLTPQDLESWLAIGGGQMLWDDLAAAHGFKPFLAGHSGTNPAIWSRRPLPESGDLQGVVFAATGLASDVARGLGAVPVAVRAADLTNALVSGRADAAEHAGAMYSLSAGLPAVAPFALTTGINRNGVAQSFSIALRVWGSLPAEDQAAIASACAEEFRLSSAEARVHERLAWRVIRGRHGVQTTPPTAGLHDAINRVSDAVVAHVAGSSREAQRINASYMAFRAMLPLTELSGQV